MTLLSSRARVFAAVLPALLALSACAALPSDPAARAEVELLNDPLEPMNREIYAFNTEVRRALEPLREATGRGQPLAPIWIGIHNVLVNLREPLIFANDLAQGRECSAGASLRRFMVNSTLGLGGIFDVAKAYGIEAHDNDVGRTLAVMGLPDGPYLMLPVLGPSDLRGTAGIAAEYFLDPVDVGLRRAGASAVTWPIVALDVTDRHFESAPDLEKLERTSLDSYAALRSAYRQYQLEDLKDESCHDVLRTSSDASGARAATDIGK